MVLTVVLLLPVSNIFSIVIFVSPGEEEEDHDNRKLRKADRMKLVVKNKEEGTELFK